MSEENPVVEQEQEEFAPEPSALDAMIGTAGAAPWWVISGAFHGLLLMLITLLSIALVRPADADVIVTIPLEKKPVIDHDEEVDFDIKDSNVEFESELPPIDHPVIFKDEMEVADHTETPDDENDARAKGDDENAMCDVNLGGVGFSTALGTGGGAAGKFGFRTGGKRRLIAAGGGSRKTESSVKAALEWLAKHQEPDGRWDTQKYGSSVKTDTACTGFALLAFLGAGHTEKIGEFKPNVRRAVAWLKSKQNAQGLVFDQTDAGGHRGVGYPHAIAAMALAEAAGMAGVPDTRAAAQRAIDYTTKIHQQGDGYDRLGFRYKPKQAGDLSVTGWYVMQLKSAKVSGLNVDMSAFDGAIRFLNSVERKGAGGDKGYGSASIYAYQPTNDHSHTAHRLTAIGALCRQFLGWKKHDLAPTVDWFVNKGGVPDAWGEGKTDLYYWYYATLCTYQQEGDVWKRWNEAMKKTLCGHQRAGGDEHGSWDPVGDYSKEWGRVGQTALACLCLEVYYRYLPVYRK